MKKYPPKIGSLRVSGANPEFNDPKYIIIPQAGVKDLRPWQDESFEQLKDSRFAFIAAFCGAGKSIVQMILAVYDVIESGWQQKQLIVVPQQHISGGFVGDDVLGYIPLSVGGVKYEWLINHNFCSAKSVDVTNRLKQWLLTDSKALSLNHHDRIITGINAIASHQALSIVWNGLSDRERRRAVKNLTLRIDEAHHVKGVYDDSEEGLTDVQKAVLAHEATNLGNICRFFLNSKDQSCKLHFSTATPYRGDRGTILSEAVREKFATYYLDWLDHWKTLGIERFDVEYEEYDGDPIRQVVAAIGSEPGEKHMVIIPSSGRGWRKDGPGDLKRMLDAIYKVVPKERVLDLVTPSTQGRNKELLLEEPKAPGNRASQFDVVVTCMLGREGTDWCPCSRQYNTSCEASITLAVQTMGRAFRRYEGKNNVKITYYVKQFAMPKKGMTKRELLSDRTNALLVCMQLDEMAHPILIPIIPNGLPSESVSDKPKQHTTLMEVFGDQYQAVKEELIEEIEFLGNDKTSANILDVVNELLDAYDIHENREGVRDALLALALRRLNPEQLGNIGIDVKYIRENGFDKIVEEFDIKGKSFFFGGYSSADWKIIRSIFKSTWEENYEKHMVGARVAA
jgi:hypothetical protein